MSVLAVEAGPGPAGHRTEVPAEEVWRAVLDEVRAAGSPTGLRVTSPPSLVLWDTETLGSPRPALLAPDPRATRPAQGLAWIAEHEPHTWALVLSGRYAAGPLASYVVARATGGLHHVTTDPAWSAVPGVPLEALPDLVPTGSEVGTTDRRLLLGLSLPVTV
jgi:hypothetical protein